MTNSAANKISGLYVIIDAAFSGGRPYEDVAAGALRGGARVIQLREKSLSEKDIRPIALKLKELAAEAGAAFIVNDSPELAAAVGADGVHLGQGDMPIAEARKILGNGSIIGISTHSLEEALRAQEQGADYIGFGPMFATATKDSGSPKGADGLRAIRKHIKIPIAAIGGINAGNAADVIAAGADAVAIITAVIAAVDIAAAAKTLTAKIKVPLSFGEKEIGQRKR